MNIIKGPYLIREKATSNMKNISTEIATVTSPTPAPLTQAQTLHIKLATDLMNITPATTPQEIKAQAIRLAQHNEEKAAAGGAFSTMHKNFSEGFRLIIAQIEAQEIAPVETAFVVWQDREAFSPREIVEIEVTSKGAVSTEVKHPVTGERRTYITSAVNPTATSAASHYRAQVEKILNAAILYQLPAANDSASPSYIREMEKRAQDVADARELLEEAEALEIGAQAIQVISETITPSGSITTTINAREGITGADLQRVNYADLCTLQDANFFHSAPELFAGKWFSVLPRQQAARVFNVCPPYAASKWRLFEIANGLRADLKNWQDKSPFELIGTDPSNKPRRLACDFSNFAFRLELIARDLPSFSAEFAPVISFCRLWSNTFTKIAHNPDPTRPTDEEIARTVETYSAARLRGETLETLRSFATIGHDEGEFNSVESGFRSLVRVRSMNAD